MHRVTFTHLLTIFLTAVLGASVSAFAADDAKDAAGPKKKVVFIAGGASHGFGAHDHTAGCALLARRVGEISGFEATWVKGWPNDKSALEGAAAVIMYCDGGGGHLGIPHIRELDALHKKGTGIGCIHYGVEVPKDSGGEHWLKWMGGYFEAHWSVNPHWDGHFKEIPKHPAASGVNPFMTNDEWYYNMRFRENMQGVTPILSAVPPDETRKRGDGPHSGNPEVRKGVGKNQKEHVLWVSENTNGSRGFGTTGGHDHWNWAQDDFRNAVLNSVVWIAKGEVPEGGVKSKRPSVEEMLSDHDEKVPANFNKDELAKKIEAMNKPTGDSSATAR